MANVRFGLDETRIWAFPHKVWSVEMCVFTEMTRECKQVVSRSKCRTARFYLDGMRNYACHITFGTVEICVWTKWNAKLSMPDHVWTVNMCVFTSMTCEGARAISRLKTSKCACLPIRDARLCTPYQVWKYKMCVFIQITFKSLQEPTSALR